ncbi:MAG: alpha-ribazole phosphatase family protein [Pseudomonadota bacterium]
MPVTLIRHTTPDIESGICYGSTDLNVAATFGEEAAKVVDSLGACDRLVSSPLQRCYLLALEIGKHFGREITVDNRLREMDFGNWEGRAWSEIGKTEVGAWSKNFLHARPHGGESVAMLRDRAHQAIAHYSKNKDEIVMVTHSGIIRSLLATGDTATDFNAEVDFGGIVQLDTQGSFL